MRIECFRYLLHISQTGSLTKSAEFFYTSQQGISQAIRSMEKDLGVTLLERTGNRISLTEAGDLVVKKAAELLTIYDEINRMLEPFTNLEATNTSLSVYTTPFLGEIFFTKIIKRLQKNNPRLILNLFEAKGYEIIKIISNDKNFIGLIGLPMGFFESDNPITHNKNLVYVEIGKTPIYACVANNSELANRKSISREELLNYPLAMYNFGERNIILESLVKGLGKPNIILKTSNLDICRKTIASSAAIGFATLSISSYFTKAGIVVIPIKDNPEISYGVICHPDLHSTENVKEFIRAADKVINANS